MSRRSVRAFVTSVLESVGSPAFGDTFGYVPVGAPINNLAIIVGMVESESIVPGSTMPVGGGVRMIDHEITLQIMCQDANEATLQDTKDDLYQAMIYKFRRAIPDANGPITIEDTHATPVETSQIVSLVENRNGRPGAVITDDWTEEADESSDEVMKLGVLQVIIYLQEKTLG